MKFTETPILSYHQRQLESVDSIVAEFKLNTQKKLQEKFTTPEQQQTAEISLEICSEMLAEFIKFRIKSGNF